MQEAMKPGTDRSMSQEWPTRPTPGFLRGIRAQGGATAFQPKWVAWAQPSRNGHLAARAFATRSTTSVLPPGATPAPLVTIIATSRASISPGFRR